MRVSVILLGFVMMSIAQPRPSMIQDSTSFKMSKQKPDTFNIQKVIDINGDTLDFQEFMSPLRNTQREGDKKYLNSKRGYKSERNWYGSTGKRVAVQFIDKQHTIVKVVPDIVVDSLGRVVNRTRDNPVFYLYIP